MEKGLCKCGCGGETNIATRNKKCDGWIKGKPYKFIRGHHEKKVRYIINDNGCWIWQLNKNYKGYGYVGINGKLVRAHRYYYEQAKGKIPKGLQLDHLCHVRSCVNPEHLEAVTLTENVRRGMGTRLTVHQVIKIKEKIAHGIKYKYLANWFNVSRTTINHIALGKTWSDISPFSRE